MNYYVYVIDIMKDVSTVVDYLKLGSLHHVRSYFWWGGIEINFTNNNSSSHYFSINHEILIT